MNNELNCIKNVIHKFVIKEFNGNYGIMQERIKFEKNLKDDSYARIVYNYSNVLSLKNITSSSKDKIFVKYVERVIRKLRDVVRFNLDSNTFENAVKYYNAVYETVEYPSLYGIEHVTYDVIEYYINLFNFISNEYESVDHGQVKIIIEDLNETIVSYFENSNNVKLSMTKMILYSNNMTSKCYDTGLLYEMLLFDEDSKVYNMLLSMFELTIFGRYSGEFKKHFKKHSDNILEYNITNKLESLIRKTSKKYGIDISVSSIVEDVLGFMHGS